MEGEATLIGPDGRPLGYYTPLPELYFIPQFDEAEMRRRIADKTTKRYTTAEVIAHLERL